MNILIPEIDKYILSLNKFELLILSVSLQSQINNSFGQRLHDNEILMAKQMQDKINLILKLSE